MTPTPSAARPLPSAGRRSGAQRRLATAAALASLAAVLLAGCGDDTTDGTDSGSAGDDGAQAADVTASYPVTISNCGQDLTFDAAPEKVVILQPLIARDMVALGLGDKIIGQVGTDYHDPVPELADVPIISSKNVASTEAILETRPDLVMTDLSYRVDPSQGGADRKTLDEVGITTYISTGGCNLPDGTVEDDFTDIENLGKIFGVTDAADALVADLKGRLTAVQDAVAGEPKVTAFHGTNFSGQYYPVTGIGLDALGIAGGTSIFPDVTDPNASVSKEQITQHNPDFIVDTISGPTIPEDEAATLAEAFPTTTAGEQKQFCFINYVESSEPGSATDMVTSIETLAKCLHPDAFPG